MLVVIEKNNLFQTFFQIWNDQHSYDALYIVTKRTELNYAHNLSCEDK